MSQEGICYTMDQCASRGGINVGPCASGFGVCCLCKKWYFFQLVSNVVVFCLVSKGCGSEISENTTVFSSSSAGLKAGMIWHIYEYDCRMLFLSQNPISSALWRCVHAEEIFAVYDWTSLIFPSQVIVQWKCISWEYFCTSLLCFCLLSIQPSLKFRQRPAETAKPRLLSLMATLLPAE